MARRVWCAVQVLRSHLLRVIPALRQSLPAVWMGAWCTGCITRLQTRPSRALACHHWFCLCMVALQVSVQPISTAMYNFSPAVDTLFYNVIIAAAAGTAAP